MGGGGGGFTIIRMPKSSVPYGYVRIPSKEYRMGIPGSIPVEDAHTASYIKLSYAGPSQHELPSRVQFLLISKAFIALNVFIPKFNYFILFCVFLWFP